MSDDDRALVNRCRHFGTPTYTKAANRIEELLSRLLDDELLTIATINEAAQLIQHQAAEIEALRKIIRRQSGDTD